MQLDRREKYKERRNSQGRRNSGGK